MTLHIETWAQSICCLLILVIMSMIHNSYSQATSGRLFYLAFQDTSTVTQKPCFEEIELISPNINANVKVVIPALNITQLYALNSTNNYHSLIFSNIDLSLELNSPDGMVAIQITSDQKISVDVNKQEQGSGGGYLALPLTSDATEFYIAAYTPTAGKNSIFTILSPFNDACVDIRYVNGSQNTRLRFMTMKQNEVFNSFSLTQDYTGIYISSTKPIVVWGGMEDAEVTVGVLNADHIIEQMPPVNEWGSQFIMSSFAGRSYDAGYQFRVVASTNNTVVSYVTVAEDTTTGNFIGAMMSFNETLMRGQWFEGTVGRGVHVPTTTLINCSVPCLVMQYNPGYYMVIDETAPYTDPLMVTVPPITHYGNNLAFSTSRSYNKGVPAECNDYITIIANQADTGALTLNGAPIRPVAPNMWRNLNAPGFSEYSILTMPIAPGYYSLNLLARPSSTFACFVYGHAQTDYVAYGYLAGYTVDPAGEAAIVASPLYNMTVPSTATGTTGSTTTGQAAGAAFPSQSVVTSNDLAPLILNWEVAFYTLETLGNLITRVCSEGYESYFATVRLPAMSANLYTLAQTQCQPGISVNISRYLYYSEYSRGEIKFAMTISGSTASTPLTFNDIVQCANILYNYVQPLSNWVSGPDVDGTEFLQRFTANMSDCDIVHLLPTYFSLYAIGFYCPSLISTFGAAEIVVPMSRSLLALSTIVTWSLRFVLQQ